MNKKSETNKNISTKESLIPVKGIDVERRSHLSQLGIETVSDLLQQGRTINQRKKIAIDLMGLEFNIQKDNKNFKK